jgi:hypothetical protein
MKYSKTLLMSSFLFLGFTLSGNAQARNCTIEATTTTVNPQAGRNDGRIEFNFTDKSRTYKIYLINRNPDEAKKPLSGVELRDLKAGFYDFVIVDNEGCSKQITVVLKGN